MRAQDSTDADAGRAPASAVVALAKRPCMALAVVAPPPPPWRSRLRELAVVFLARQWFIDQLRQSFWSPYGLWHAGSDGALDSSRAEGAGTRDGGLRARVPLGLTLLLMLVACGVGTPPPVSRPGGPAASLDMAPPNLPDGGACLPCKPDQPDTCLGHISQCLAVQGTHCCFLPCPYSCKWHTCAPSHPASCEGGTCQTVSGGSCCVYGARLAPGADDEMAARIKRAADRDDARSVVRRCGKNARADSGWLPRSSSSGVTSPEMGGDPPPAWLGAGASR